MPPYILCPYTPEKLEKRTAQNFAS